MFHLTIVTAEKQTFDSDIKMLVAPSVDGEIGILTGHQPIVTKLGPGGIKITNLDGSEELLFTSGGYLEVKDNKAVVLADVTENLDEIEASEAADGRKLAQERLKNAKDDVEFAALEEELRLHMLREKFAQLASYKKKR